MSKPTNNKKMGIRKYRAEEDLGDFFMLEKGSSILRKVFYDK
jgi:hypothetical protein